MSVKEILDYYAVPGSMTDPAGHRGYLSSLPADIPSLVKIVQNNILHVFWAERYGVDLDEAQKATLNVRSAAGKLAHLKAAGVTSLVEPRTVVQRQVGNCRDFSLLLVTFLRHQGIPARARCGFGTYFLPGHFEDHWVVEYWDGVQARWVWVDPQIDELMAGTLQLDFDPLDLPPGKFVTGGQAWQMARSGQQDPQKFGIFDMHGMGFIWGDLVRDMLALNKVEILPWDGGWGAVSSEFYRGVEEEGAYELPDRLAALTADVDACFDQIRAEYETNPALHPPEDYFEKEM